MTTEPKTNAEIIKEIESGKYRDCYLVYNRKSTDEPDNQKNSIRYQNAENLRSSQKNALKIAPLTLEGFSRNGVVSEQHSAFKESDEMFFGKDNTIQFQVGRPKFFQLTSWLNKGYFKGSISLCWDRVSRNKSDTNIVNKLIKNGVDMRFTLTDYDKSSSGELHQDIDGMFAEHHSRVTKEKVSLTIKNCRERGIWTNKAPVGYLNEGIMENKPVDFTRAGKILRFAKLADEGWSLADIARWAIEQGFTMPPVRRRRTNEEILIDEENDDRVDIKKTAHLPNANTIHKILTNRFYTGKILTKDGRWIQSACHEAIIPEDLFNRVQEKLQRRNKSAHYLDMLDHPCRGMFRCGICHRVYTPYDQKGIIYFGARCAKGCSNLNKCFNIDFITEKVGNLIINLPFTDEEIEKLNARTSTEIALFDIQRQSELDKKERRKKTIRESLTYLSVNRLELLKVGTYTPAGIVAEENKLSAELSSLQEAERVSDVAMREMVQQVQKLSELTKDLYLLYKNATPQEKEVIINELFSELTLDGETLKYKCTIGFQPFAHHIISICDPTENRTLI
ncbi:MAG: recombinase family protein [Candidatus Parcubacteria bacterium]|nr:recombinase family protein [Candidatus Parcubacteria bacterium]